MWGFVLGAAAGAIFGGANKGVLDLGAQLLGEGGSNPLLGSIIGGVGRAILTPSPKEQAKAEGLAAGEIARQRHLAIRRAAGLPDNPPAWDAEPAGLPQPPSTMTMRRPSPNRFRPGGSGYVR